MKAGDIIFYIKNLIMKFTQTILATLVGLSTILFACNDKDDFINPVQLQGKGKPDNKRPIVTITSPMQGTVIAPGSQFTVTANATDNIGVTKVGFTFNGYYISMTTGPYSATYTMPSFLTEGMTMWVIVEANDAAGNSGFQQIYFKVGNP